MNSSIIQKLYLTPKFVSEQKKFWEKRIFHHDYERSMQKFLKVNIYAKSAGKI